MSGGSSRGPQRRAVLLGLQGLLLGGGLAAGRAHAQGTWLAGPEGSALTLDDALRQARDGDTVELLPGNYRGGLVLEQRRITLRGAPGDKLPVIKGDGLAGAARALWTVRGGQVTLQNLEFRGARSSDGSGAGVRLDGGELRVQSCNFFDNEHGIFASNDEAAAVTIDDSVIGLAPKVVGGLHHLLNIGRIARLVVSGSRFQQGFEGHLIKTRARENRIHHNFIHDGERGGASYELDIANGGLASVLGNVIGQGSQSQNPVLLGYATEDRAWDRNELLVVHNTFINHGWLPAWFVRVIGEHLPANPPGSARVQAFNNLLVGPGVLWPAARGNFNGNRHATRDMLRDAATYAFELPAGSVWRGSGVDLRNVDGRDLSPQAEFMWPVGTRELRPGFASWTPGAFQR
ncbi:MAG: hypothetical protein LH480_04010 [Rubrivivax sp.]|nr:hypothetical protein [Rubrivivax sp.]